MRMFQTGILKEEYEVKTLIKIFRQYPEVAFSSLLKRLGKNPGIIYKISLVIVNDSLLRFVILNVLT